MSYTPPPSDDIEFVLEEYSPPAQDAVNFVFESPTVEATDAGSVTDTSATATTATETWENVATDTGSFTDTSATPIETTEAWRNDRSDAGTTTTTTVTPLSATAAGTVATSGVVTHSGNPISGARVTALDTTAGEYLGTTTTDASGEWSLEVAAGSEVHLLPEHQDNTGAQYKGYSNPAVRASAAPPDEQNLVAHWDFSQTAVSDGATYTTVEDRSGNGHTLDGYGATHTADGINGLPSAYLDGSTDHFEGPTAGEGVNLCSTSAEVSVYIVWQALDPSNVGYTITQTWNGPQSLQEFSQLYHGSDGFVRYNLGGDGTDITSSTDTDPHTTAALINRPTDSAVVSWDGETQETTTGDEGNIGQPLRIGARGDTNTDSGTDVHFNGHIGEVLVYDGQHDTPTHESVMAYLSRWTS